MACDLLNQRHSVFLTLWDLSRMVTAQEAFAILPADVDLAPVITPFVDGWRLLNAEKEETATGMMGLEEERIQLSDTEHYICTQLDAAAEESDIQLIVV
jgi:hypothetical protein